MVVHTGGKSLHGWFKSTGDSHLDWEFMRLHVYLEQIRVCGYPSNLRGRLMPSVSVMELNKNAITLIRHEY